LADFDSTKIDGESLEECLACFEAEKNVIAFQTKEAGLFNETMSKHADSVLTSPASAKEAAEAARRLKFAADEILKRFNEISPIPRKAIVMHQAWFATLIANRIWALATCGAIEAMTGGMSPDMPQLQQVLGQLQETWESANEGDKEFLAGLGVSSDVVTNIVSRATAKESTWEPHC
jgi:hypothetical protein